LQLEGAAHVERVAELVAAVAPVQGRRRAQMSLGLHNIFVHSIAFLHLLIILFMPPPSALLTLLQYYRATNAQHTTPDPSPLVYAIHHNYIGNCDIV